MWEGFRRLYLFVMTENMRAILRRWQKQLFTEQVNHLRICRSDSRQAISSGILPNSKKWILKISTHEAKSNLAFWKTCFSGLLWKAIRNTLDKLNKVPTPLRTVYLIALLNSLIAQIQIRTDLAQIKLAIIYWLYRAMFSVLGFSSKRHKFCLRFLWRILTVFSLSKIKIDEKCTRLLAAALKQIC